MTGQRLGRIRFADKSDTSEIITFINESTRINFRITKEADVRLLLENNVISIVQLDHLGSIIGFLSLKDSPLHPVLNPASWEDMVWTIYRAVELNARNTLFIHMFCWKSGYGRELVDNILRSVFMHDAYLHHIAVIKPLEKYQYLYPGNASAEASFRRVQAVVKGASADKLPSLWIADRNEISPRLRIRRAVEEDNDDIIPILEDHSPQLKQIYGEYYISELVAHPGSRVLLVCERKETAVGVMCLNTEINYEALEEAYILGPFAGLKHTKENLDEQPFKQTFDMESATEFAEKYSTVNTKMRCQSFLETKCDIQKVSWPNESSIKILGESISEYINLLQDEDVEYEIINIKKELMVVPRQLSIDQPPCIKEFRKFLEMLPESHDSFEDRGSSNKCIISTPSFGTQSQNARIKRYTGEPNAFILELFAMHPDIDERCGFDILQVAYETFPNREYCILTLPSNHAPFPLLEHFTVSWPNESSIKILGESISEYINLLQDEDVEYEIINIKKELMVVPRQLSIDQPPCIKEFRKFLEMLPESHDSFEDRGSSNKCIISTPSFGTQSQNARIKRYTGEPNAFILELFAMHPDIDERCGFDILQVAYETFPNREYCILTLPSNHAPFPLLEHFTMVPPLQTTNKFKKEVLYVAHINSIRGKLRVRAGQTHDLHYLYPIVERSGRRQHLLDLFHSSLKLNNHKLFSYVLLSENQPVGVIILGPQCREEVVRTLLAHINPESKEMGSDAIMHGAVVSPMFETHFRWLLREVIRQSQFATLFWPFCLIAKGDFTPNRNLMILTNYMVPLYARTPTPIPNITKVAYLDLLSEKSAKPLTYSGINRPITSLPKIDINNNIVVVGSSTTGLAFIEALVMGKPMWYLNFTNVTLVSETGLTHVLDSLSAAVTCIPRCGRFTNSYMKKVPFICYIDIIPGTMVKINRKNKSIVLMNGHVVYYDTLVLTCGLQFQHPGYFKGSIKTKKIHGLGLSGSHKRLDDPVYKPDQILSTPDLPRNVMVINDIFNANLCLKKLLAMIAETDGTSSRLSTERKIIVCGDCIEVYSCMAALLELKIKPIYITFVESYNDHLYPRVNCFNDEKIDERVQETIKALGIQVYRRCNLVNWTLKRGYVKTVTVMSMFKRFDMNCFVLFYYGCKSLNENTFKAMNESGLVYDGGLVVGADFETNDPHIYGAGTCTRYSRRLYADKYLHKYYYSEDIGETLAAKFLNLLDPFVRMNNDAKISQASLPGYSTSLLEFLGSHMSIPKLKNLPDLSQETWMPVLKFDSPVYVYTMLPGPLYYLKLRKPGRDIPMEVALSLPHQGHTLETENNENFFRMKFSVLHIFEGATCLCKSKFQPEFYIKLYGKHEKFFNNLFTRYETNMIKDLNEHLTQPWISALYLICFNTVFDNIENHKIETPLCTPSDIRTLLYQCVGKKYIDKCLNLFRRRLTEDFPSTCGQPSAVRAKMATFWEALGGESIVWYYLSDYLHRYAMTNPQYMKPKSELIFMCHL